MTTINRLKDRYRADIIPALMDEFAYDSIMQVPRLDKVVLNIGMGEALTNAKSLDFAAADFKAEPASGRLLFLEINNGPMFVAFDRAAGGELSAAIVCALAG